MILYFFPKEAFTAELSDESFIAMCKVNALCMIMKAGRGHIGSSFSALHIAVPILRNMEEGDYLFSSKGHDCAGLYAAQMALGMMPFNLDNFRQDGGLPGHPDPSVPGVLFTSGSLGMGVSKAFGLAIAKMIADKPGTIHVIVGDGELDEGQIWEALGTVRDSKLPDGLVVHIDDNKASSSTKREDIGDLSCDWLVRHDGVKSSGVDRWQGNWLYHSGAPSYKDYVSAVGELLAGLPVAMLALQSVDAPAVVASGEGKDPIPCYSAALLNLMRQDARVICLTADLSQECGLGLIQEIYPERVIDVGIKEQHMVSMASGLAAGGYLPIVHSFASFLMRRAFDQIFINNTEPRKIIYVGALAGIVGGNAGPSHDVVDRQDVQLWKLATATPANPFPVFRPEKCSDVAEALHAAYSPDYTQNKPVYISLAPSLPV